MAIPVPSIDATGMSVPTFTDILAAYQAEYRAIYGSDVVLDADTQDGQWVAIQALAYSDLCNVALAVYNAFSPSTAQGEGLSRVVKINGIARHVASYSSVDLLLGGTAGTVITNGAASDGSYAWALPASVTIPSAGQITVTATCTTIGAITAPAGTITTISTPTRGWQSVTNSGAATAGNPVEVDAALRTRQRRSTALPSASILEGIEGAILALSGVVSCRGYENDTPGTDENGIPGHSISMVVQGGDAASIAATIAAKKGPGTGTYGSTAETVTDAVSGLTRTIAFQRPANVYIDVEVDVSALTGFTSIVSEQIQASIETYLETLTDGDDVYLGRLYTSANLYGGTNSTTYDITAIRLCRHGGTPTAANVSIGYAERARGLSSYVTVTPS